MACMSFVRFFWTFKRRQREKKEGENESRTLKFVCSFVRSTHFSPDQFRRLSLFWLGISLSLFLATFGSVSFFCLSLKESNSKLVQCRRFLFNVWPEAQRQKAVVVTTLINRQSLPVSHWEMAVASVKRSFYFISCKIGLRKTSRM